MKKQVVPLVFLIIALIFSGCKSTSIEEDPEAELSLINPMGPLVLPLSGFLSGRVNLSQQSGSIIGKPLMKPLAI